MTKNNAVEESKKQLGKLIADYRKELDVPLTMRKLAEAIELSPSNMKYIEDGVNAPSHKVYAKIIKVLNPSPEKHVLMDELYTKIRKTPPPDVCNSIIKNQDLFDVLRLISGQILTAEQISQAEALFKTFTDENKGEIENGK